MKLQRIGKPTKNPVLNLFFKQKSIFNKRYSVDRMQQKYGMMRIHAQCKGVGVFDDPMAESMQVVSALLYFLFIEMHYLRHFTTCSMKITISLIFMWRIKLLIM